MAATYHLESAVQHMDAMAESVKAVFDQREQTRGLKMVYEPQYFTLLPSTV